MSQLRRDGRLLGEHGQGGPTRRPGVTGRPPGDTRRGLGDAALRADLAGRGMRLTAPRRLILAVVRQTESHPTAEWVHAAVRRHLPRVSLGTVYRNLRLLAEEGLLAEIHQGPSVRFDARVDRHHHFTCTTCRRIFDLAEPVDARLEARVAARTGFRVSHHRIEFYGLCAGCLAGQGRAAVRRGFSAGGTEPEAPHPSMSPRTTPQATRATGGHRWPSRSGAPRATRT